MSIKPGTLAYDEGPVKRLKREDRVARWKERKPLLDEDPDEWPTQRRGDTFPPKTNMTGWKIRHLNFEDVFPVEYGDVPMVC